jgi:hypothetical protein
MREELRATEDTESAEGKKSKEKESGGMVEWSRKSGQD